MRDATQKIPAKIQRLQQSAFHPNSRCNNFGFLVNQNNWEFRVQFSILRWERLRDAIQKIPTKIQLDVANNVWINFCVKIFPPPHKLVLPNLRHKFNQKSDRNWGPINPELKKSRAVLSNLLKSPLQSISNQNNWERLMRRPVLPNAELSSLKSIS